MIKNDEMSRKIKEYSEKLNMTQADSAKKLAIRQLAITL